MTLDDSTCLLTNHHNTVKLQNHWEWHYNMDTTGIPAEHTQSVFQDCEWRCEGESTKLFASVPSNSKNFAGLDAHGSEAQ